MSSNDREPKQSNAEKSTSINRLNFEDYVASLQDALTSKEVGAKRARSSVVYEVQTLEAPVLPVGHLI